MDAFDLSLPELTELLAGWNEPAFRARQIYAQLWRRGARFDEMTDLPAPVRDRLAVELPMAVELIDERTADRGATRKALLKLGERRCPG